jgi:hypothetical protein
MRVDDGTATQERKTTILSEKKPAPAKPLRSPRAPSRQRNRLLAAMLAVIAFVVFTCVVSLVVLLHEADLHALAFGS